MYLREVENRIEAERPANCASLTALYTGENFRYIFFPCSLPSFIEKKLLNFHVFSDYEKMETNLETIGIQYIFSLEFLFFGKFVQCLIRIN